MELSYEHYPDLPEEPRLWALLELLAALFGNQSPSELLSELTYQSTRTGVQVLLAIADGKVAGCKLGYERNYSWLGIVKGTHHRALLSLR